MMIQPIEVTPGEVWESIRGKHRGLRVEVERDTGPAVKVKVLRGFGASAGDKKAGHRWSINRDVFLSHYRQLDGPVSVTKPKVETDLGKLLANGVVREESVTQESVAPEPDVETPDIEEIIESVLSVPRKLSRGEYLHSPEYMAKREETMRARVAAITPEQRADLRQRRLNGASVTSLASEFKLDTPVMGNLLHELGVYGKWSNKLKKTVLIDTLATPALAPEPPKKTERPRKSVLMEASIKRKFESLSAEKKVEILADYEATSYWEVMRKHRLLNGVVASILREAGIEVGTRAARLASAERYRERNRAKEGEQKVTAVKAVATPTNKTLYRAVVLVMQPVQTEISVEAEDMLEALALAGAYEGTVKVRSIAEATE